MNTASASLEISLNWARAHFDLFERAVETFRAENPNKVLTCDTRRNGFITIRAKAI